LKIINFQDLRKSWIFVRFLKESCTVNKMIKYKNLSIIGTSHIAKQSLDEVKDIIEHTKPYINALELDKKRFYA